MRYRQLFLLCALSLLTISRSATASAPTEIVPGLGVSLGGGWDSLRGISRGLAVVGQTRKLPAALSWSSDFHVIESKEDLVSLLQQSFGASGGFAGWSASARLRMVRDLQLSQYSFSAVFRVRVIEHEELLVDPVLSRAAQSLLAAGGPTLFRLAYGDRYNASLTYGGEYYGVLTINARSQRAKDEAVVAIKASGPSVNFEADFTATLETVSEYAEIRLQEFVRGTATLSPATDFAAMLKNIKGFSSEVLTHAVPIAASFRDYSSLPEFWQSGAPLAKDYAREEQLRQATKLVFAYETLRDNAAYVLDHPDQFYWRDSADAPQPPPPGWQQSLREAIRDQIIVAIDSLDQQILWFINSPDDPAGQTGSGDVIPFPIPPAPTLRAFGLGVLDVYPLQFALGLSAPVQSLKEFLELGDARIVFNTIVNQHAAGDQEMGGQNAIVTVTTGLNLTDPVVHGGVTYYRQIEAVGRIELQENGGDTRLYDNSASVLVARVPNGYLIEALTEGATGAVTSPPGGLAKNLGFQTISSNLAGSLKDAVVDYQDKYVFPGGSDLGISRLSSVLINTESVRVRLVREEGLQ